MLGERACDRTESEARRASRDLASASGTTVIACRRLAARGDSRGLYASSVSEESKKVGAGPFVVGERVYVQRFESAGTITGVGRPELIRVYASGNEDGELREVTTYTVKLDNGIERGIVDRDGQLEPI